MVTFIHCADIHLGRVQNQLEQRFVDFGNAFRYVVEEALARRVNFVLVSGDLFDKRNINARTLEQAVEILEPLKKAGIRVIAIEGNHDKAFLRDRESWMSFLAHREYIVLLAPDFAGGRMRIEPYDAEECRGCYIDLPDDVRVYGLGYLGRAAGQRILELAEALPADKTNLVLLHAMVGRMGGELIGSIPKRDVSVLRERVTYLALGHGHNCYVVEKLPAQTGFDGLNAEDALPAAAAVQGEKETVKPFRVTEAGTEQLSLFQPAEPQISLLAQTEAASPEGEAPAGMFDPEFPATEARECAAEEVILTPADYAAYWGHNPGSTEHCRLDEAEHRQGFFHVEMEGRRILKVEHIPSRQRPARMIAVDITGSRTPDEAYEQILTRVREETEDLRQPLLRLIIKGEIGFDILELDEEWLRGQVEAVCAPLILEIDIRVNLPQFSVSADTAMLDRQSIEREVLRRKVEDRAQWRHLGDELVQLIFEIREDLTHGLPADEIAAKVMRMAGDSDENS